MENLNEDVLRVFKLAVTGTSTSYNLIGVVGSVAEPVGAKVSAVLDPVFFSGSR